MFLRGFKFPSRLFTQFLPFHTYKNPRTMAKSYNNDLRDPRWQKLRLLTLERDNFTCVLCTDDRTNLQVHHTEYKGKPWDIAPEKLKTLCAHCHSVTHALPGREIEAIHKRISLNAKCWEIVAFTTVDVVFLYLFFTDTDTNTDKTEIITVFPNPIKEAA